jgi:hypothetical protein
MEKLERLELCGNTIAGDTIGKIIATLYPDLVTLKLSNNAIAEVDHI